ncbi:AraC family transcriptional regulator [Pseudomonas sp. Fl4BN1]|uniref:AraC family transcriptional regulator n=1 Tax=Pseudomonas sp. Fl4BN1 TaxID=2697651 RepID=UPI001377F57C|nr:AraC family transcriptional regulator [Pseudomonas sp. Fl4BN1]NBF11682.1 helix-turn-helix domain-containing protein [Pseudomonas sp. Fl4BN1]
MKPALPTDQAPRFWRDPALPFIEARSIADGRQVCYSRHAHDQFSIGCITAGHSTYLSGQSQWRVDAGTVVLMNPGVVHACNPIDDQPWAYRMLYVDTPWLTRLQHELGFSPEQEFRPFDTTHSHDPQLFAELEQLYQVLVDEQAEILHKHSCTVAFFSDLQQRLNPAQPVPRISNDKLQRAALYIRQHCTAPLTLEDICQAAQLSASYLIRAFKQQFGMPPHAYLVNQRVQFAQARLRNGAPIAEVALEAGFADQAHFQRAFKQHLAATPGQYRRQPRTASLKAASDS